ncbi:hypothetical protein B0O80DRAFT_500320 [Mortierella sp. GBAus27b]|nr:hypothetical protein BGX31_006588 [Mortierella sp. GBA43]KAI8350976.1 hypothetical protein B0O80DRAFT_500320 [Mortierella sp. GBAus27b]
MDPSTLGSYPLATFPIGLGLTAAAHIHLCRRTLAKVSTYRAHCDNQQASWKADNFALTIANSMEQMTDLIDYILSCVQDSRSRSRRRRESKRASGHTHRTRDRKNSLVSTKRSSGRSRPLSVDQHHITTPLMVKDVKGKGVASATPEDEVQHHEGSASTVEGGHNAEESSGRKQQKTTTRSSGRRKQTIHITPNGLETWSKAYGILRRVQERRSKTTFRQTIKSDPIFTKLQGNAVFLYLLGGMTMIRYLVGTNLFKVLASKVDSWMPRLGSFVKWIGSITPPSSTYVPWKFFRANDKSRIETKAGVSTGAGAGAKAGAVSAAFAYLPVAPTLLVAGIYFLGALRAQWAIRKITKQNRHHVQYAKRLGLMSTFMLIREQRLEWLAEKIRDFEEEMANNVNESGQEGTEKEDDYEDVREGGDVVNVEDDRDMVYENTDTAALVTSLLGREADNDEPEQDATIITTNNNNNAGTSGQGDNQSGRRRVRLSDPSVLMLTFGANLEKMDMQQFLKNPAERSKVLRMEFEGMRQELTLFRESMMCYVRM